MIDVAAMFSDQEEEIPKSGGFSNRSIGFSEVRLFIALNY